MKSVKFIASRRHLATLALLAAGWLFFAVAPRAVGQVTIPLQAVNLSGNAMQPEYKLGIYVGLGGGAPKLYEFDTGGAGFFAAYSGNYTPWWTSFSPTGQAMNMTYTSGATYNATIVSTQVSLYASDSVGAIPLAAVTADVGQVFNATGGPASSWNQDLIDGTPPLFGHFYGDFGMALYRNQGNDPVPIGNPGAPSLYAVVPQLGANTSLLGNGFIVRMGGDYFNPTPTLQIGLTPADRAHFADTVAMNLPSGLTNNGTFPNGGGPSYSQQIINGTLTVNGTFSQTLGVVLDTGAPSTEIHTYGNITFPGNVTTVALTGEDSQTSLTDLLMSYTKGNLQGLDAISHSSATNPLFPTEGFLNSGLNIFFQMDVMFDLENNRVGFAPATVPEPATAALWFGMLGLLAFMMKRRGVKRS